MIMYGDDAGLEDITPRDYRDLLYELNKNSAWKTIATYIKKSDPQFSVSWIDRMEQGSNMRIADRSPAECLWNELRTRNWDIETLCDTFRTCQLLDAFYILGGREDLVITEQPCFDTNGIPYKLGIGDTFSITCKATGLPLPKYQWIFGNNDLPDQTSSTLNLLITSLDQEGEYQCRVSHYNRDNVLVGQEFSNCIPLSIKPTPVKIIKPLPSISKVKLGENLILSCEADGHPIPEYQWFKGNKKLDGENSNTLQILKFKREDKGEYHCFASNGDYNDFTKTEVKLDYLRQKTRGKVALLIGNRDYENDDKLPLTTNDVELIGSQLKELGFHVMCWQNLNLKEMRKAITLFCSALQEGCYGFFYFAGHGFKMTDCFLKPVDTPEEFLQADTISQDNLLSRCLEKKPALFVSIFDMCLTKPPENSNPKIREEKYDVEAYECNENLIIAYSTCDYNSSHEIKNANNGVYATHLSKYLTSNVPIDEILVDVAYSVRASTDDKTKDQKPMLKIIPMEPPRYLTDAVTQKVTGEPSPYILLLDKLTTFEPKTVQLTTKNLKLFFEATVQLLEPYFNVLLISITGLEDWEVTFESAAGEQLELYPKGTGCIIYNPQRQMGSDNWELIIHIRKNGKLQASKRFRYKHRVSEKLCAIWENDILIEKLSNVIDISSLDLNKNKK